MLRPALRAGLLFAAVAFAAAPASAQQLTINFSFDNSGFYSADRQQAIIRAADYIATQIDARGTIAVSLTTQDLGWSPTGYQAAFAGTSFFFQDGGFTNGVAFGGATANNPTPGEGFGTFNNNPGVSWHTGTGTPGSGQSDMQSVALHELTHVMGFTSLIRSNGAGLQNLTPGSPDTYSQLARHLRLGTASNAPLLVNPNGTFNSAQVTTADLAGNNIYFHGEMAMAANGGQPVRMAGGGDSAHLHSSFVSASAVMTASSPLGSTQRTYTNIDLAMLIDMGWNQFVWKNTDGTWAQNVSSTSTPEWENLDGLDTLSPVGTITPNLVLRFGGAGGYTSTNNLGLSATGNRFLANRLILNGTAGTSTIASNGTNVLRFDTTIGVTPLIRQDGAGAFNISHPIELTAAGLQLGGNGAGRVTLGGAIGSTGGGALTKIGTSTFELAGSAANTYAGPTAVNGGVLVLNKTPGVNAIPGAVTVNTGGALRLAAANQIADAAAVTLSGGTLSTKATDAGTPSAGFSETVGAFQMTADSTIALGTGDHTLTFTGITGTPTAALTVLGWAPDGGNIVFTNLSGDPNATYTAFLSAVTFQGHGGPALFLPVGGAGTTTYELAPVPEPTAVLAVAAGVLGAGAFARRRLRRGEPTAAF